MTKLCPCGGDKCIACKRNKRLPDIPRPLPIPPMPINIPAQRSVLPTPAVEDSIPNKKGLSTLQKLSMRNALMYKKYNITRDEYERIAHIQGYKCGICNRIRKLTIDHDHSCCAGKGSCGKCIRGLICANCNSVLGMCGDDINVLKSAIEYLSLSVPL